MKRLTDAVVDGVLGAAATRLIELKGRVEEKLMRQLFVGQATRKRRVRTRRGARRRDQSNTRRTVAVELDEGSGTRDLLQLGPKALDLGTEFQAELGVCWFVRRKVLLRLVKRDECVLDARRELDDVGTAPVVEATKVSEQPPDEAGRQLMGHAAEGARLHDDHSDALQAGDERDRRIVERLLSLAHGLEDVRRTKGDHVRRQEHPHVDGVGVGSAIGSGGRRAVAHHSEAVHALEEVLGGGDHLRTAQVGGELHKTAENEVNG